MDNYSFPLSPCLPLPLSSSSSCCQIRTAQQEDLAGLAKILADCFHHQTSLWSWTYPLMRLGIYEDLRHRFRSPSPHHVCLVAIAASSTTANETGKDLAGTVEMMLRSPEIWRSRSSARRYIYLSNLAVSPEHRRQGVAQQLLLNCEQIATSWGFQEIYLHVLENNHPAQQLYFKLGYCLQHSETGLSMLLGRPRKMLLRKQLSSVPGES